MARLSESEFQGWVIDTARALGWRVWHAPTPMRPVGAGRFVPDHRGAGLPDLFMLRADPARLIMAELKGADGRLSDGQREFLGLARGVSARLREALPEAATSELLAVYVWRPEHQDLIESILRSEAA